MRWIEKLEHNAYTRPSDTALVEVATGMSISYGQLDELSGRVYHALKEQGIGKEDVVLICLPRGYYPFIAAVGAWKAGAAVVIMEANEKKEKKEYIYENSQAVCLIDLERYQKMILGECEKGHAETDLHDKAYLVYTSGTTGLPKAVVHEYGSMEMCVKAANYEGQALYDMSDRFALTSSLHFSATYLLSIPLLYEGGTLLVFPMDCTMNVSKIIRCIKDYRINCAFFTPSLLKMIGNFPVGFQKLMVAAEPVRNIYYEGVTTYNLYGQSESGYYICAFRINQPYKMTPIGKPHLKESGCCILDEEGNPAEQGEICYRNPYFRGYLDVNDGEVYGRDSAEDLVHSGDLGKYTQTGEIVHLGRLDNMVKIHGNRVELEALETILCDVLQISWVGTCIKKIRGKEYVCAYYVEEPKISFGDAKEILQKKMPAFMIPAFFVHITKIPGNDNGKLDRKSLPMPKIEEYQKDYVNPVGRLEVELCNVMARILDLSSFSAEDDFYNLGGDSIGTLELVDKLNWPYLDISMIYVGKTPRNIASIYKKHLGGRDYDIEERNENALREPQELSMGQIYMLHYQSLMNQSTVWNIPICLRLSPDIDLERIRQAIIKTLEAHPVFATKYKMTSRARIVQIYNPEWILYPDITNVTEEEFEKIKGGLIEPFQGMNEVLYRIKIFQTEKAKYIFADFHHSIVDGTSLHIIMEDIMKAYEDHALEKDYYYLHLEEELEEKKSSHYDEARMYYSRLLDGEKWSTYPKADYDRNDHSYGNITKSIPLDSAAYQRLKDKYGISKNAFFIAVLILAIANYNQESNIRVSWVFNGRKKKLSQNIVGSLIQDCYIGIRLDEITSISEYFEEIQEQIRLNLYYSCYSYPGPERMNEEGEDASLLYQSGLRSLHHDEKILFSKVDLGQKPRFADNILDMEILDEAGHCVLYMDYIASMYEAESMEKFAQIFASVAEWLAEHMGDAENDIMQLRKMSFLD